MFHAVISDTHSAQCTQTALSYLKKLVQRIPLVDTIVLNGDIMTSVSMGGSNMHQQGLTVAEKQEYLRQGAPKFYKEFAGDRKLNAQLILMYMRERYDQTYDYIKDSCKIQRTVFNLGNHESEFQLMVLQELSMLTAIDTKQYPIAREVLVSIIKDFEKKLYALEKKMDFYYVRERHIMIDDTLIVGIPGISHATVGQDPTAKLQEDHTKHLIENVKKDIAKAKKIVIYNHTQGDYDEKNGRFQCASPSLKEFINNIPSHVQTKIFVQSHNHWSYTQCMEDGGVQYILNNAGLHSGIFNLLSFDGSTVVYDVDPNNDQVMKVKMNRSFGPCDEKQAIARYYDDVDFVSQRKKSVLVNRPVSVEDIKRKVFA